LPVEDDAAASCVSIRGQGLASGLRFIGTRMLFFDVSSDYISGGIDLPGGFVVETTASR
jgi:hypothetical protein